MRASDSTTVDLSLRLQSRRRLRSLRCMPVTLSNSWVRSSIAPAQGDQTQARARARARAQQTLRGREKQKTKKKKRPRELCSEGQRAAQEEEAAMRLERRREQRRLRIASRLVSQ